MNKKDLIPVILLALLIPVWVMVDRAFLAKKFPAKQPAPAPVEQPAEPVPNPGSEAAALQETVSETAPAAAAAVPEPEKPAVDEVIQTLENDKLLLELTSYGAGIKSATLLNYPELNEKDSPPVVINFSRLCRPCL